MGCCKVGKYLHEGLEFCCSQNPINEHETLQTKPEEINLCQ